MSDSDYTRSVELLSRHNSRLLVIDVQEKLIPLIPGHAQVVENCVDLLRAAGILNVPISATEQYPRGLGPSVPEVAELLPSCPEKTRFSAAEVLNWSLDVEAENPRDKVVICGIEAHVCVMQTALDLLSSGFRVHVAADAIGSRFAVDRDIALQRLRDCGAVITTTETAIFEWCEVSGTPEFKEISALIQERASRHKT